MNVYKTFKHKKDDKLLEIVYDESPESPREFDNIGIMVCCHGRYTLGDKQFNDPETIDDLLKEEKPYVILPLYLLDHSGIAIRTTDFNDYWDSGQVGYIYTTKEQLRKMGHKKIPSRKKVEGWLKDEVSVYDDYLSGNVFGFVESKIDKCDLDHEHKEHLESCFGFFGDLEKNGIFEEYDKKEWEEIVI